MRVLGRLDSLRVKCLDKGGHGSSIHTTGFDCQTGPDNNSRARILRVLKAGDSDFVAAVCAKTDRPACFICKAASQKAWARRVLRTTPLLQPNCGGVPLSKLLCILSAQEMGRTLRMIEYYRGVTPGSSSPLSATGCSRPLLFIMLSRNNEFCLMSSYLKGDDESLQLYVKRDPSHGVRCWGLSSAFTSHMPTHCQCHITAAKCI
ncbi:hypothetical protein INR49_009131 [Caranx melampygus]|nr:hypothetical protein INR49_009131 [Caranx melampygus]